MVKMKKLDLLQIIDEIDNISSKEKDKELSRIAYRLVAHLSVMYDGETKNNTIFDMNFPIVSNFLSNAENIDVTWFEKNQNNKLTIGKFKEELMDMRLRLKNK